MEWISAKWEKADKQYFRNLGESQRAAAKTNTYQLVFELQTDFLTGIKNGSAKGVENYVDPAYLNFVLQHYRRLKMEIVAGWEDYPVTHAEEIFRELVDRERSRVPGGLHALTIFSYGPTIVTKRVIWCSKKNGRIWTTQKKTTLGIKDDQEEQEVGGVYFLLARVGRRERVSSRRKRGRVSFGGKEVG